VQKALGINNNLSITLIVSTLILGSLIICFKNPNTNSKFLDLAQSGLGGYLAILVQGKITKGRE